MANNEQHQEAASHKEPAAGLTYTIGKIFGFCSNVRLLKPASEAIRFTDAQSQFDSGYGSSHGPSLTSNGNREYVHTCACSPVSVS